uniref:Large ribosomal subunit protein mL45 n=1 Tax=Oryza meridionalis TaxID=40149 RepID=A0A0E0EF93_9ORYZ
MALARLGHAVTGRLRRPLHLLHPPPPPLTDHHAAVAHSFALIHESTRARGFASSPYNAGGVIGYKGQSPVYTVKVLELLLQINHTRSMSTAAQAEPPSLSKAPTPSQTSSKVPLGARKVGMKVVMMSPGFVYEPYSIREPIPFWKSSLPFPNTDPSASFQDRIVRVSSFKLNTKRWFTPSGWRRTKEDVILEMKNAYAVSRLRKKTGYTKKQFYDQAFKIYKEVNTLMARGDTPSLRKILTERMHSTIKNELKKRQSMWSSVHWELVEPAVCIRTLRARMIGLDKNDLDKAFIQLTLEFVTKQKFEAYNTKGEVVSGDKSKEVLVKDIWVFERSLFHPGAYWRVCGRITL